MAVVTQLTALIAEVADIKKALISPDSAINWQVRDLQDVTKQQEVIAKQQRFLEDIDGKQGNAIWYYSVFLKSRRVWKALLRMMQKSIKYGQRLAHLWA